VILAAGKGERMRPLTDDIPKALVNIAGKTLLEWAVDRYRQSGINDIVIAVGWKSGMIEDFISNCHIDARIVNVPDYERGPLQTFLSAIETFDDDFLLSPVDAVIDATSMIGIQDFHSAAKIPASMTLAVGHNTETGTIVKLEEDGLVTNIGVVDLEERTIARSAMMLVAHTSIRDICKSALDNGKKRVAQLLEQIIRNNGRIRSYQVSKSWFDIDTLSDVLDANKHLLRLIDLRDTETVYIPQGDTIEVGGLISLKSGIELGNGTALRGPVLITQRCEIGENCMIGPNVTISANSTISAHSEITNSVIFGDSQIPSRSRLNRSVIYKSVPYHAEA
jgi:NDP-sugar pyrophosphorylase family protein